MASAGCWADRTWFPAPFILLVDACAQFVARVLMDRLQLPSEMSPEYWVHLLPQGVLMADVRILVVDDEPSIVRWVSAVLQTEGYEVETAEDGQSVIWRFKHSAPGLVLLDVTLPKVDGFELLAQLRELSSVPIIMMSGNGDEQTKIRCLALGADDYLFKPFGTDELVARIEATLRRSQREGESGPA